MVTIIVREFGYEATAAAVARFAKIFANYDINGRRTWFVTLTEGVEACVRLTLDGYAVQFPGRVAMTLTREQAKALSAKCLAHLEGQKRPSNFEVSLF